MKSCKMQISVFKDRIPQWSAYYYGTAEQCNRRWKVAKQKALLSSPFQKTFADPCT